MRRNGHWSDRHDGAVYVGYGLRLVYGWKVGRWIQSRPAPTEIGRRLDKRESRVGLEQGPRRNEMRSLGFMGFNKVNKSRCKSGGSGLIVVRR